MISFLKRISLTVRLLIGFLRRRLKTLIVQIFFPSSFGISLVKAAFLLHLIRNRHLPDAVAQYLKVMLPEQSKMQCLIRQHQIHADRMIWSILTYDAWDTAFRYHDLSEADHLRTIVARGNGLLLLGMHYGPMFTGYLLYRMGLNPVILSAKVNIPDIDGYPCSMLLPQEVIFRGSYDGILEARHSEKKFIRMMMSGRPGMIVIDSFRKEWLDERNYRTTNCLGIDYPLAVFPFKLALKYSFPVAIVWLSKIKGRGYKLNVREIHFSTINEGVVQYCHLLDKVARSDPHEWQAGSGNEYILDQLVSRSRL